MQHAGSDPWAAGAAAARAPLLQQPPGIAPAAQGQPQHFSLGGKGGAREPRDFRVDSRAWGSNRHLDLIAAPDAYLVWHDRALGHLRGGRPDVRKLLLWAEGQTGEELAAKLEVEAERIWA